MAGRFVALLRGINVGGRNLVTMSDLRAEFERAGHRSVETYIQSGNVVFEADEPRQSLEASIEQLLSSRLGASVMVVVRSKRQIANVVASAPDGFGTDTDHLYDVVFLKAPMTSARAMQAVAPRGGVDRAWPGPGVLYFARLASRRAQSRLSRIVGTPEYQLMTIRNWATTKRIHAMLGSR